MMKIPTVIGAVASSIAVAFGLTLSAVSAAALGALDVHRGQVLDVHRGQVLDVHRGQVLQTSIHIPSHLSS